MIVVTTPGPQSGKSCRCSGKEQVRRTGTTGGGQDLAELESSEAGAIRLEDGLAHEREGVFREAAVGRSGPPDLQRDPARLRHCRTPTPARASMPYTLVLDCIPHRPTLAARAPRAFNATPFIATPINATPFIATPFNATPFNATSFALHLPATCSRCCPSFMVSGFRLGVDGLRKPLTGDAK